MKHICKLILLLVLLIFCLSYAVIANIFRYIIYPLWEFKWWKRDDTKVSFIASCDDLIKDITKDIKEHGPVDFFDNFFL